MTDNALRNPVQVLADLTDGKCLIGIISATFANMLNMELGEREACRNQLLRYCGLDTLAMVKVWQKLTEVIGNNP